MSTIVEQWLVYICPEHPRGIHTHVGCERDWGCQTGQLSTLPNQSSLPLKAKLGESEDSRGSIYVLSSSTLPLHLGQHGLSFTLLQSSIIQARFAGLTESRHSRVFFIQCRAFDCFLKQLARSFLKSKLNDDLCSYCGESCCYNLIGFALKFKVQLQLTGQMLAFAMDVCAPPLDNTMAWNVNAKLDTALQCPCIPYTPRVYFCMLMIHVVQHWLNLVVSY